MESMIRDIALAPSGKQKISWVKEHMPLLNIPVSYTHLTLPTN